MNRLGLIPCLSATLALPACSVTHNLGETAEESSDGSGAGSGSTDDTSVGTNPDPSATSGQPGTTTEEPSTGGSDPSVGESTTATDGESCEGSPEYVRWLFDSAEVSPLEGVEASYAALLYGQCMVTQTTTNDSDPESTISLDCSLTGRIDDVVMDSWALSPHIRLTSTVPGSEVVDTIYGTVNLRLVLDFWGMGWNGWLVLETLEGTPLLDLMDAEYLDPTQSTWGLEVEEMVPADGWHGNLQVSAVAPDPVCEGSVTDCGDEASVIAVQHVGEDEVLYLPAGHEGLLPTPEPGFSVRASVTSAHTFAETTCTDLPSASYALAAWTVGP